MQRMIGVLLVLALFFTILVVSTQYFRRGITSYIPAPSSVADTSIINQETPILSIPDGYGLEPPTLDGRVQWTAVPLEQQELSGHALQWYTLQPYRKITGDIRLYGNEWHAVETVRTSDEAAQADRNREGTRDYEQELLNRGWTGGSQALVIGNYGFSTMGYGGVTGYLDGYLKAKDGMIRVVKIRKILKDGHQDAYSDTWEHRVFVSDVITSDDFLNQIHRSTQ